MVPVKENGILSFVSCLMCVSSPPAPIKGLLEARR